MKRNCALVVFLILSVQSSLGISDSKPIENIELDPLRAAPETHRLNFENQSVRVLDVNIPPGYKEPVHSHLNSGVMVIYQRARIRYYDENGVAIFETKPSEETHNVVQWHEPEGPHSIENIDTIPFTAVLIELKKD